MFEVKLDNAKYWRDCVESIVSLIDEGTFNITEEGISLRALDPSNISMVVFSIPKKSFSTYKVEENNKITINIENLAKILSRAREHEQLVMKDSDSKLVLEFIGNKSRRRYKLPLLSGGKTFEKEPKPEFDAFVEISSDHLKDIIKDVNMISTHIQFKASKNDFSINAVGEPSELEETHEIDGEVVKKIDAKSEAKATFNIQFLENMVKSCPSGNKITLALKNDEPLKLSYKIGDADVVYYLAPYTAPYSEE
ncbi:MAG: proliferating cell nuclear antigen (pcna) [Candidatus Micrarchaeaceae archaeon]